jgi:EAL domain-containing protein (putative c-di-GMP-specific phosphodiesterase class I)
MLSDRKTRFLISSMIEMGHNLGHEIIAEGVETLEQFNMLKNLGCDTAQGYLFSKPVPANEVSKLLNTESVRRRSV